MVLREEHRQLNERPSTIKLQADGNITSKRIEEFSLLLSDVYLGSFPGSKAARP
jgi:hypothetical protein